MSPHGKRKRKIIRVPVKEEKFGSESFSNSKLDVLDQLHRFFRKIKKYGVRLRVTWSLDYIL